MSLKNVDFESLILYLCSESKIPFVEVGVGGEYEIGLRGLGHSERVACVGNKSWRKMMAKVRKVDVESERPMSCFADVEGGLMVQQRKQRSNS